MKLSFLLNADGEGNLISAILARLVFPCPLVIWRRSAVARDLPSAGRVLRNLMSSRKYPGSLSPQPFAIRPPRGRIAYEYDGQTYPVATSHVTQTKIVYGEGL